MNRTAALAFGIPLLATVGLLIWRERGPTPRPPAPQVTAPASVPQIIRPEAPRSTAPQQQSRSFDIAGVARVIDGDTLDVGGVRIRLNGIDAPEAKQSCGAPGRTYACGDRATEALRGILRDRTVLCRQNGTDAYKRVIATCFLGDDDLNQLLVAAGWAVAFRRYSLAYVAAEVAAKAARRGMWADAFEMPWEYRARLREARQAVNPD
jgi:endonuclease YncB( thermonuclease family)